MVHHTLFCYTKAVQIQRMADFLSGINLMDSLTQLFQRLKLSMDSKMAKIQDVWMAYVAYHIQLSRNSQMLESRRFFDRFILEHAPIQAIEITHLASTNLTMRTLDSQNPHFVHGVIHKVFISWEPLPSTFFNVNFDGNIMGSNERADFVIRGFNSRLVAACGSRPKVELQAAQAGIVYAKLTI